MPQPCLFLTFAAKGMHGTGLGIGSLELADGRIVKGFICEPWAISEATDITHFGGWRSYIQSLNSPVKS